MKFQTTARPLRDLVEEFSKGAILLPQFQRDFVWQSDKIRNLLDSLLRGFPIGGFYLWRPTGEAKDPKSKAFGTNRIAPVFEGYLIDGQQRLTSLEAAFGFYTGEEDQKDQRGNELRCYLDLAERDSSTARTTRLFVSYGGKKSVRRRVEQGDSTLVSVKELFFGHNPELRKSIEEALRLMPGWDATRVDGALQRLDDACEMLDQPVPCTTVSEAEDHEAVEVFNRLNKGGRALKQGDVRAAELARGPAVQVLKQMREFVSGEQEQRLGFSFNFAFRALVVFHRKTAQFKTLKPDWMDVPGPYNRPLDKSWRATKKAIAKALRFIDRMGWSRKALLPSGNAIIVLAAAFDKADSASSTTDDQHYRRWLSLTALRGVFQGSVETTINRFLRSIRKSTNSPAEALLAALKSDEKRKVQAEELYSPAQPWGPATQVMHAWLVAQRAKDWVTGESVDALARAGKPELPGGDLTVHHLFPRRVIADEFMDPNFANCPANYALLSRPTNSELGDKPADEAFSVLTSDQRKRAAVQFFGEAAGDKLRTDRYNEFCEWRADRLAGAINDWLGMD